MPKTLPLAVLAAAFLAPLPALACSCVPPNRIDTRQFLARTPVVFWGRAVGQEQTLRERIWIFEVAGAKGALPVRVRVHTRRSAAACGATFRLHETVLVGAGRRGNTLYVSSCGQYTLQAKRAEIERLLRRCRPFGKCP